MTLTENARLIEAILFLENEPLSVERIGKLTGLSDHQVERALNEISEVYYSDDHGLALVENSETYSFVPVSNLNEKLRACYGKKIDKRLSKAAIETLAIVAYSQPITRSEITKIRGVVSDSIIRILRERDYIKVVGRKSVANTEVVDLRIPAEGMTVPTGGYLTAGEAVRAQILELKNTNNFIDSEEIDEVLKG